MSKLRSTLAEKCFTSETVVGGHRARELKIFVVLLQEKCSYDVNLQQWRPAAYHAITPPRQLFLARILWKRPFVEIRYHFVLRFTFLFTNIAQKS